MWTDEEVKRAEAEDCMAQKALEQARARAGQPMSTPESIRAGDAAMAKWEVRASETLARRIESKELLSAGELRDALEITQVEIDDAVEDNRLFAIDGPDGKPYYPAFYADANLDKVAFWMVAQELRDVPATSKFHFFVSKRTNLSQTPLEALRRGRVAEVLRSAAGFANT